jgi:hypothetical protein
VEKKLSMMRELGYGFWLAVVVLGAITGPVSAFLAGMVVFTVREERQAFLDRHPPRSDERTEPLHSRPRLDGYPANRGSDRKETR